MGDKSLGRNSRRFWTKITTKTMNKLTVTLTMFTFVMGLNTLAQTQIENGNFENWENLGSNTEEPTQWSSLKTSTDNSILNLANQAPQVIWRETSNPHGGSACIRLKVAPYNTLAGLSPNAIITNGRVFADITPSDAYVYTETSDPKWNSPTTDKPDSLVGWYKYAPQSGDKGKVEVLFHTNAVEGKLPENGSTAHHIGSGIINFTTANSTWTRFSFPINYTSTVTPNYFLMVATAGDELNAVENSELWLDDLAFVYNPPLSIEEVEIPFTIYSSQNQLNLKILNAFNLGSVQLLSLDGKTVWQSNEITTTNSFTPNISTGIYIYQLLIDGKIYSGKIVLR